MKLDDWPPNYTSVYAFRQKQALLFKHKPELAVGAKIYYSTRPVEFINHWCETYNPRNIDNSAAPMRLPLVLFKRQVELIEFLQQLLENNADGLVEKSRDVGASWVCCAFSIWMWLFHPGSLVGWGSKKEEDVDSLGNPSSLFEKMRMIIAALPPEFLPAGFSQKDHLLFRRIINPETGATIIGQTGDNIGRGSRATIYFKDESAHYERPEKVEAALSATCDVKIDISSVNGFGNVFHRKREAGVEWSPGAGVTNKKVNVFILDWSDHPGRSRDWYELARSKAETQGTLHLFAQEVDRDYSGAIENTIIPSDWVTAAIDSHLKLGIKPGGNYIAGVDVADGGKDKNAIAITRGPIVEKLEQWSDRDTGLSARRVVDLCKPLGSVAVQYDCIGVGAGVKAESNRLADDGLLPKNIEFISWDAGASPQYKDDPVIENDPESPLNGDFYTNLKAQAWWQLRRRFEKTHRAVYYFENYPHDELVCIPSNIPHLRTLQKELSQPTVGKNSRLKLLVNKTPNGMMSPNLADALVMAFWPVIKPVKVSKVINKPRIVG